MPYIEIVAILALLQYLGFGGLVARARGRYGVHAPAVSGHEMFDRAYRVQMNTLEQLVVFLPALFVAGRYWPAVWVAGAGLVYLVGRLLYWRSYMRNPASRELGFVLTLVPSLGLLLAGLAGAVMAVRP
jgi:glutathione S-transferase